MEPVPEVIFNRIKVVRQLYNRGVSLFVLSGTQKKAKTDTDKTDKADKTDKKQDKTVKTDIEKTDKTGKKQDKTDKKQDKTAIELAIMHKPKKTDKTDKKQDKTGIALATNKYLSYMLAYYI